MTGAKTPRYRVCFDFGSAEAAVSFWEDFVATNLSPDGNDFSTCELVFKDDLHDQNFKVTTFLVRERNKHFGNGRPVKHTKVSTAGDSTDPKQGQVTNK
jgi:hypothetical protein